MTLQVVVRIPSRYHICEMRKCRSKPKSKSQNALRVSKTKDCSLIIANWGGGGGGGLHWEAVQFSKAVESRGGIFL